MKNLKKWKKEKKELKPQSKKSVYGIHDLLFLPLVVGMAFTNDDMFEETKKVRKQLMDKIEEELNDLDQRLDEIHEEYQPKEVVEEEVDSDLITFKEKEYDQEIDIPILEETPEMEEVTKGICEVELQLASLVIEKEEPSLEELALSKEEISSVIGEYQEWLDDQVVFEKLWDTKEKEMNVKIEALEKTEKLPSIVPTSRQQKYLKELTSNIEVLLQEQQEKVRQLEREIKHISISSTVRKRQFALTNQVVLQSAVMYQMISKAPIHPVHKFVLQTVLLHRTMRMSRRVVEVKEDHFDLRNDFQRKLKAIQYDVHYAKHMLGSAVYQMTRAKKQFIRDFSDFKDQLPEYDLLLKEFKKMEEELFRQEKNMDTITKEVEKQLQKKI